MDLYTAWLEAVVELWTAPVVKAAQSALEANKVERSKFFDNSEGDE